MLAFRQRQPDELEEKTLLLKYGELTLARNISRSDFLRACDLSDDFARGMEFRSKIGEPSDVGDIVVTSFPFAPHESATRALDRGMISFIDRNTPNLAISTELQPTGSTRYTDATRSAEADGGWRPKGAQSNAAGQGSDRTKDITHPALISFDCALVCISRADHGV